jgi:hypothetical protein
MDASCLEETKALWGLLCAHCGQSYTLLAGIRSLSFHCPSGHSRLLGDLLRRGSESDWGALEELSLIWERKLRSLRSLAAQARADGYRDLASTFHRKVEFLEERQGALWNELGNAELRKWGREALAAGMLQSYK